MAVSVNTSGSQTATVTTEHDLATITSANVFVVAVDTANMVSGTTPDRLRMRVYGKARSSDTELLLHDWFLPDGVQALKLWESIAIISPHHLRVTLTQTQGTGRAFPWAIYQVQ